MSTENEKSYLKLNSSNTGLDKKSKEKETPIIQKDRRDGSKKWLILTLILISSVRKKNIYK